MSKREAYISMPRHNGERFAKLMAGQFEQMSDTFQHYEEIDLQKIVDEQARKLQRRVDEATLDKAADTLARFGYVKVDDKSRWFELFGTPERAARTVLEIKCGEKSCKGCPIVEPCFECDVILDGGKMLHDSLIEWLRGDA